MKAEVYSDGSATTKDKPGGYGYVIVLDDIKHSEGSGQIPNATNNDAELMAAVMGLGALFKMILAGLAVDEVWLVSDSQIVLGWATGKYRCKQKDKLEKFTQLKELVKRMKVQTRWVRGHSGDENNTRCDKLAGAARKGLVIKKQKETTQPKTKSLIGKKKLGTMSFWYKGVLKILDADYNIIEDYDKEIHGSRKSYMELRIDEK